MDDLRRELNGRAETQHGLVTSTDLDRMALPRYRRRSLVACGTLVPLGRRTYAIGGSPETLQRRVMAGCLDTAGFASHATAAWLHGINGFGPGAPPSVVVRRSSFDCRSPLATVHSSTWLPDNNIVVVSGIPTLNVARTLFSLASAVPIVPRDAVAGAIDVAIRDGKATDAWLWWALERIRRRGRNGVGVFEELLNTRAGGAITESWLEREFLRVLRSAGIELPICQRRIRRQGAFVARVDFAYPSRMIVVEVNGHASHSLRRQNNDDASRRNALTLAGYRVLEFTYDQVVGDPSAVVAQVLDALHQAPRTA